MLRRESFSPLQWLLLGVFAVYCLLPLWWVIVTMFKDNGQLFSTVGLLGLVSMAFTSFFSFYLSRLNPAGVLQEVRL